MGILRLGHVDVRVPDLDLAAAYYTSVLGLIEVAREPGKAYLKCWDEQDHHSVVLRYHPRPGLDHMSFKVESPDDLQDLENRLEAYGAIVHWTSPGEERAVGQGLRFETPSGHLMELVHHVDRVGSAVGTLNPLPRPANLEGIAPPRLDHMLVTAEEVGDAAHFYADVLGFRLTEQLLDGDGHQLGVWMERSPTFRSTSGLPVTESPAARPSTSSTRSATATRSSRAGIGPTRIGQSSPGRPIRWVVGSSIGRTQSMTASSPCIRSRDDGYPPTWPRRHPGSRPRAGHGVLHRSARAPRSCARAGPRLSQMLGRARPHSVVLRYAPRYGPELYNPFYRPPAATIVESGPAARICRTSTWSRRCSTTGA